MPSYCTAINCKSNGFSNPTLSFFKFPLTRPNVLNKWIKVMRRDNKWEPSKHSRLCSIHFQENCFFLKKGTRLRLLPDAIPTIFDFRTIKSNRKKAQENALIDMDETEYPEYDRNLYELETETHISYGKKVGQKCRICKAQADCDITLNSIVNTKKGKISLAFIVKSIFSYELATRKTENFICLVCSQRLITAFRLRIDLDECPEKLNETLKSEKEEDSSDDESNGKSLVEMSKNITDPLETPTSLNFKPNTEEDLKNLIVYCAPCKESFKQSNIGKHLSLSNSCKMRKEAELKNIHRKDRHVIVCCMCAFLLYKHNAEEHINICGKTKIDNKFVQETMHDDDDDNPGDDDDNPDDDDFINIKTDNIDEIPELVYF